MCEKGNREDAYIEKIGLCVLLTSLLAIVEGRWTGGCGPKK